MNKIIWLTGPSTSGKTTLANALKEKIDCINLDGDEMRDSISLGLDPKFPNKPAGFTKEDRTAHNLRIARLAMVLAKQKTVIVSVIAPIAETRRIIDGMCHPQWVYMMREVPDREGHFYEEPHNEVDWLYTICVDNCTVAEEADTVIQLTGLYLEEES